MAHGSAFPTHAVVLITVSQVMVSLGEVNCFYTLYGTTLLIINVFDSPNSVCFIKSKLHVL
jgi:hypothetical protein